jgi:hypothetical protein
MTTVFQPNAFQSDANQIQGGQVGNAVTLAVAWTQQDESWNVAANVLNPVTLSIQWNQDGENWAVNSSSESVSTQYGGVPQLHPWNDPRFRHLYQPTKKEKRNEHPLEEVEKFIEAIPLPKKVASIQPLIEAAQREQDDLITILLMAA